MWRGCRTWNCVRRGEQTQNPRELPHEGFDKVGDDLLSRYSHYHGPQVLNGRVRNENGCGHLGMVTGKTHVRLAVRLWRTGTKRRLNIKKAADRIASLYALLVFSCGHSHPRGSEYLTSGLVKELINAVKQSAVSTGKLRPLLILHIRPIDPVVFREPMYKVRET